MNKTAFVLCIIALVFTTVAYGGVHTPIIAVFYLLIVVAGIASAADGFFEGRLAISRELLQLPLLAAACYAVIQIVPLGSYDSESALSGIPRTVSLDPHSTWVTACQLIAISVFFAVLLNSFDTVARIRRFTTVLGVFAFGFAFFAILQSVLSPDKIFGIYDVSNGTPFGSFVNRNNFAAYMEMTTALPLGLLFAGAVAKDKRLLLITAIVLMGVALLLCRSRGGLVAYAAEIILLFFLTRRTGTGKGNLLRVASIALLVIAVVAGSIFVGGDTSLTRFADTAASSDFSTDRSHIWSVTTEVIREHFPLGAGFGAFAVAYTQFDESSGLARVEQAHNDYLQVIADAGLPGAMIGSLFLLLFFRKGREAAQITNNYRRGLAFGAFAGCFAVLVHSIFDFVLHVTAIALLFVSLLALLSAACRDHADDIPDENQYRRRKRHNSPERVRT
jgi:O-antigen ligase